MFAVRKTFELAVCLLGYWLGKGFGGWGGGIILAFVGLCATSYGWERLTSGLQSKPSASANFAFSAVSALVVAIAAFILWGK